MPVLPRMLKKAGDFRSYVVGFSKLLSRGGSSAAHRDGAPVLGPQLVEGGVSGVSALLSILKLGLHLAELGQVDGGDLLSLLDLSLVGLDLGLEFVHKVLETLLVLAVLIGLEGELLEAAVGLAHVLLGLGVAALLVVQLGLQLADSGFEFLDDLLASLESLGLGLVQTDLEVLELTLGSLAALLGSTELVAHLVQIGLHGLDISLQLPLLSVDRAVLGRQLVNTVVSVVELTLSSLAGPLGLLKGAPELFNLAGKDGAAALGEVEALAGLLALAHLLLDGGLHLPDGLLVFLDVLLQVSLATVGGVKGDLELVDVLLKLLLDADGLGLALGLSLKGSLDGVDGALVVATGVLELFLLIGDAAVDVGTDGGDLQLCAHDLGLLLLKSGLSLLEGSLEPLAGLVELVGGAASLAKLI